MFGILICLIGAAIPLLIDEFLYRKKTKIFQPEDRRKFVHITVGAYVAAWPWIISWRSIQIIGLLMMIGVFLNQRLDLFRYSKGIGRQTFGEYYFALAIVLSALLTDNKVFFALGIFTMALADGAAALAGKHLGKKYKYDVFGQTKTLIGTMTFWICSLVVLAVGILFVHDLIPYARYYWLILLLPPTLSLLENISVYGLDDFIIPIVTIVALRLAQV